MQRESPEQREMRSTVRALLSRGDPIGAARTAEDEDDHGAGFDLGLWRQLATELGVSSLLLRDSDGGLGLTFADAAVVLEEAGRTCYNGPCLESAVVAPVLLALADQDVEKDLRLLGRGQAIATVAGIEHINAKRQVSVTATHDAGGWTLDGAVLGVPHGMIADLIYLVADSSAGLGVWVVRHDSPGHERHALATLDFTRPMSAHTFASTPARLVRAPSTSPVALHRLGACAIAALTAEQVGATSYLCELTVDYVRTRYQFGRAVGSFQVVKHRCVNMAISSEGATAASVAARDACVAALAGGDDEAWHEAIRLSLLAGAFCSDALVDVAGAALQLHGGIGMSWEHDIHVYLRRSKASQHLFGTPRDHRRRLGDLLGLHLVPSA